MIDALSGLFGVLIRRPWAVLVSIAIVTVGLVVGASGVRLDGDLARLLPESARSVQGLQRLEEVYGDQIGRVTVILSTTDESVELEAEADAVRAALAELPGVDRAESRKPQSLLGDLRLVYLDEADLESVRERIAKRIKWEKKRANPLFVDLGSGKPPEVDVSDIEAKYGGDTPYYRSDEGQILVFVRPTFSATDLDQTEDLVAEVEETTRSVLAERGAEVRASFTGRYVKRIEQQSLMIADIGKATSVAFVLLALLLLIYFRSFVTMSQVILPLVVGTAAAMTLATLMFGSLNILTGFLGAILLGLGVDYGIHLVSRFHEERQRMELSEAMLETFRTTGKANLFAGMTTAAALGSLTVSSFRAFFEFGIIALVGIVCILLAYTIVLPALAVATERLSSKNRPSLASWLGEIVSDRVTSGSSSPLSSKMTKRVAYGVLGLAAVVAALGLGSVKFDSSFDNLTITNTPSWELDQLVNDILGESQTPAVVLVENAEHEAAVVEELEKRAMDDTEAVQKVIARRDLLPGNQSSKLGTLRRIKDDLEDVPKRARSEELESFLTEIDGILDTAPVELSDLPKSLSRPFSRTDGEGSVVLVLPGLDLNDLENSRRFVRQIQDLPGASGDSIDALSDAMLLTEIFDFVQSDIQWMIGLTFIGLLLIALLAFGPRRDALVLLGTLSLSLGAALGLMGLLDVDFNFINVLIIPIWLGLGVDASFHVIMHIRQHPDRVGSHVATVGSVAAAFLTSMTGFGAMSLSHHNGLSSLASVAIVGLGTILVVNVAVATILSSNARSKGEHSA